ncbi:MAG TPA: AsmA family protein [Casimicrobiaceae bacterium]|nr:AsmA family protein [Casimicrobiaceae bacterium]
MISFTLIGIVAIAVAAFEWNWLRGPVASYLSVKLDRQVKIDGDLHVELWKQFAWKPFSWKPLVTAEYVTLGNAPWASDPVMARARQIGVQLDLLSLLKAPVALPEVTLVQPQVQLERKEDGAANWIFKASEGPPPRVDRLMIEDGVVHFQNGDTGTDVTMNVATSKSSEDGTTPVEFKGSGHLRNNPFTIEGSAATLLALEDQAKPYRLNVRARAGDTSASFDGTLVPEQVDNVNGKLTLQGRDLSQLYPIIPVPFPWTPQYRLSGQLEHANAVWTFKEFKGKVGDSDLAGNFVFDGNHPRPMIDADLVSTRLDYKDLGGLVGLPPPGQPPAARTPEQNREAAQLEKTGRVLPTTPFDLQKLRVADAKVRFKGKRFIATALPLDDLKATVDLNDGVLKLQPVDFGIAGGHVVSTVVMDARSNPIRTSGDVSVSKVELKDLVPKLKPPNGSAGKIDGRARFATTGNSVAEMLATSNGEIAVTHNGGNMSELAIVLTNIDLQQAIPLLVGGDKNTPLNCTVADFVADNGRMTAKSFVIDTAAEKINGEGSIDFTNERYDLKLKADSKRASLIALRGPVLIDGSFKSPQIHIDKAQVALRAGAAAALGFVTPPAALLPLIETGGAKDADCVALTQEAQANVLARPEGTIARAEAKKVARSETTKLAQDETTKPASR